MGQLGVALLTVLVVLAFGGRRPVANSVLANVLTGFAYLQVMGGVLVSAVGQRSVRELAARRTSDAASLEPPSHVGGVPQADRKVALHQALLTGVMFATPIWFLAFAWLTGQTPATLAGLALALALGYGMGLLQLRPLSRAIARPAAAPVRSAAATRAGG